MLSSHSVSDLQCKFTPIPGLFDPTILIHFGTCFSRRLLLLMLQTPRNPTENHNQLMAMSRVMEAMETMKVVPHESRHPSRLILGPTLATLTPVMLMLMTAVMVASTQRVQSLTKIPLARLQWRVERVGHRWRL